MPQRAAPSSRLRRRAPGGTGLHAVARRAAAVLRAWRPWSALAGTDWPHAECLLLRCRSTPADCARAAARQPGDAAAQRAPAVGWALQGVGPAGGGPWGHGRPCGLPHLGARQAWPPAADRLATRPPAYPPHPPPAGGERRRVALALALGFSELAAQRGRLRRCAAPERAQLRARSWRACSRCRSPLAAATQQTQRAGGCAAGEVDITPE